MVPLPALLGLCLLVVPVLKPGLTQAGISTGEFGSLAQSYTLQPLNLTLKGALAAAINNNPDVLLYKERI